MKPNTLQKLVLNADSDFLALGAGPGSGKTTAVAMLCADRLEQALFDHVRRFGKTHMAFRIASVMVYTAKNTSERMSSEIFAALSRVMPGGKIQRHTLGQGVCFSTNSGFQVYISDSLDQFVPSDSTTDIIVDNAETFFPDTIDKFRAISLRLNCKVILLGTIWVDPEDEHPYASMLKPDWVPYYADYRAVICRAMRIPVIHIKPKPDPYVAIKDIKAKQRFGTGFISPTLPIQNINVSISVAPPSGS